MPAGGVHAHVRDPAASAGRLAAVFVPRCAQYAIASGQCLCAAALAAAALQTHPRAPWRRPIGEQKPQRSRHTRGRPRLLHRAPCLYCCPRGGLAVSSASRPRLDVSLALWHSASPAAAAGRTRGHRRLDAAPHSRLTPMPPLMPVSTAGAGSAGTPTPLRLRAVWAWLRKLRVRPAALSHVHVNPAHGGRRRC